VTLYHSHAAEALPEEHLLELADWCYRKLAYLNAPQGVCVYVCLRSCVCMCVCDNMCVCVCVCDQPLPGIAFDTHVYAVALCVGFAKTIYNTGYIRYFWQGSHQRYGHMHCVCTALANPI
jgi:hypothetical protein